MRIYQDLALLILPKHGMVVWHDGYFDWFGYWINYWTKYS